MQPAKVTLELTHAREVLTRSYPNGRNGGIRVDGVPPGPLGTTVQMVISVAEPAERKFRVRGVVSWVRRKHGTMDDAYGVDFLAEDGPGRERLLAFASDRVSVEATRYQERVLTDLPVKITHQDRPRKETLFDLSEGGAFVRSRLPIPVGDPVKFELRPPLSLRALTLDARVAWIRREGDSAGYGLEFTRTHAREQERIRKLLERLRQRDA